MSQTFPPVRLAALDLDGTLLNHEGQVTPRTRAALQAASDRGVVIVPTTGRPLGNLPPVVAQLPGVRYAITSNGAAVWDLGSDPLGCVYSRYANAAEHETSQPECIVRRCFPVEKAREVYEAFHGLPGGLNLFSDGRALRDMVQQCFFDERFARLAAVTSMLSGAPCTTSTPSMAVKRGRYCCASFAEWKNMQNFSTSWAWRLIHSPRSRTTRKRPSLGWRASVECRRAQRAAIKSTLA